MNTGNQDAAIHMDGDNDSSPPSRRLRQWWSVVTTVLATDIFVQAVFAGAMLSGVDWARAAHSANAIVLIASTLAAGLTAAITLWRVPQGFKLALTLVALAVVVFVQTGIGKASTGGANLMWVHVPLGVALLGFAGHAVASARRLGR